MRAVASVEGPGTALQTVVHSRPGGLIRFEQHAADGPRFIAGIGRGGGWSWSVARGPVDLLVVNHSGTSSPEVRVRVFDWPQGDSVRLFRRAVILYGSERAGVETFEPSAPIDGPVRREREEGCP